LPPERGGNHKETMMAGPLMRLGDKTACGAVLIAGQQATIDNI